MSVDYDDLIARLEAGSGEDRELAQAIADAITTDPDTLARMRLGLAFAFNGSLDASFAFAEAVGLTPEHDLQIWRSRRGEHLYQVRIGVETCFEDFDETGPQVVGEHDEAPRALLIAALKGFRALQEQSTNSEPSA